MVELLEPRASAGELRAAGAAVRDVTPSPAALASGEIFLGGFGGPARIARLGQDRISARALALDAGPASLVLLALDLPSMSNGAIRLIQQEVEAATGCPAPQVLVGVTHTHAGPDLLGLWGGVPESYRLEVLRRAVEAAGEAWAERRPAELWLGRAEADSANRRGWGEARGELLTLQAREHGPAGATIATLINFAAHPTVLLRSNLELSRDYVGFALDALEARQGGAPAIFFNGALGDVRAPAGLSGLEAARRYGERVAAAAWQACQAPCRADPQLQVRSAAWELRLPRAPHNPGLVRSLEALAARGDGPAGVVARRDPDGWSFRTQTACFRLGAQLEGLSFPGEALSRHGRAIARLLTAPFKLLLGLTGDNLGYVVPADEWGQGRNRGYEESVSLHPELAARTLEVIEALLREERKRGAP